MAKPWFDQDCFRQRKITLETLHKARRSNATEDLAAYSNTRRSYKQLIKEKRKVHREKEAEKIAEEANKDPFIASRKRIHNYSTTIQMETWESHFTNILNTKNLTTPISSPPNLETGTNLLTLTKEEVKRAITRTKNGKAAGPNGIFNEHIKATEHMPLEVWIDLHNKCIDTGHIPEAWRRSVIKILYKAKGDLANPNSFRGIALENNYFKIFSKLITEQLIKETDHLIPEQQYGFRKH